MEASHVNQLERHLSLTLNKGAVRVIRADKLSQGGARSSQLLTLEWGGERDPQRHEVVLKQDPLHEDGSLVPGSVVDEYAWFKAMHSADSVRVPRPLLVETTGDVLGSPFMITMRVLGETNPASIFRSNFSDDDRLRLALDALTQLGRLSSVDVQEVRAHCTCRVPDSPGESALNELTYWEAVLNEYSLGPLSMVRTALRWLKKNLPQAPTRLSVVHGDFRLGNFLFSHERVEAVLDWEMSHIGDPLEDLAWAMHPKWAWKDVSKVWGIADPQILLPAWEQASGTTVDPNGLRWWRLFTHVKSAALWLKAAHAAAHRRTDRVDYITVHWLDTPTEERHMAKLLQEMT